MRIAAVAAIALVMAPAAPAALAQVEGNWGPCEPACDTLVDTTVDAPDAAPGDGRCATAAGECSLRAAVQEGNARWAANEPPFWSRIVLPPGRYVLTHHGAGENNAATGDLDVKFDGAIVGSGVGKTIVDGDRADRVFSATEYGLGIAHMTIRGGRVVGPGGGILSRAQIDLAHLEVTDNEALDGVDTADPPLSDHMGNSVPGRGGGLDVHDTLVVDTWIHHNTADYGGGMQWHGQQAGFARVTLDHNHARVGGGGLRFAAFDAYFSHLTVSENTAGVRGGGVEAQVTETFWGVDMSYSTIAGNSAPEGGGMWLSPHTDSEWDGPRTHAGLLIADNAGDDCGGPGTLQAQSHDSRGGNVDSDGTCGFTGADERSAVDAKLGPLQDNGGPTPTRALLPGSPAINLWPCTAKTDQRGAPRPQGAGCDSGAFEVGDCCPSYEVPSFEAPRKPDPPGPNPPGPGPNPPGPNPPGPNPPGPNPPPPGPTPPGHGPCGPRLLGTKAADRLVGNDLPNDVAGRAGADTILGLGGDDCLFGNAGDDVLKGGPGVDRLEGGSGHDRLVGGDGNDRVKAGPGNDVVDSRGKGYDRIDCGPGRDRALVGDLDRVRNCERVRNVD